MEHEPEPVPAQLTARLIAQGVQPPSAEPDLAIVRGEDPGEAVARSGVKRRRLWHAWLNLVLLGGVVTQAAHPTVSGAMKDRAD